MTTDPYSDLDKFFDQLPPLPDWRGADCPPDSVLCDAVNRGIDEQLRTHLAECTRCVEVINVLRDAHQSSGQRLQQFLAHTKMKAQKTVSEREHNWPVAVALWSWISLSHRRQIFAYGVASVLLLGVVSVSYRQFYGHKQLNQSRLELQADDNQKAFERSVELLQSSISEVGEKKDSPSEVRSQVEEINRVLRKVDASRLSASDRATVVSLVRLCQLSLEEKPKLSRDVRLLENSDTQKVNNVLATFADYSGRTSDSPELRGLKVVSFEPDSIVLSDFLVSDSKPNSQFSDPATIKAWQEASNTHRVKIKVERTGITPMTFTPYATAKP